MWQRAKIFFELMLTSVCMASVASAQTMLPADDQVRLQPDDDSLSEVADKPELPVRQISRQAHGALQNTFYNVGSAGRLEPQVGHARLSMPDVLNAGFNFHAPFLGNHGAPTNAEVQIGRFYYDLQSLSVSLLYSDNVERDNTQKRGAVLGIINLRGMAFIQLLENLRLSANLGFVVLPFKGKAGIEGFMNDTASGRLFFGESERMHAQLAYDLELGNWNWLVYDDLTARQSLLGDQFNVQLGDTFSDEDRQGRYVIRSPFGTGSDYRVNETSKRYNDAFVYSVNRAGVTASRMLPTVTRLSVGVYRDDFLYAGGDTTYLPRSRDTGFLTLRSERENLRFKPFASYHIYRENSQSWDQEARVGATGPLTENISLAGSVGWFMGGHIKRDRFLVHASIQHDINPHLRHAFIYRRDVTTPEQDLEESFTYNIHAVLGPYLRSDLFFSKLDFQDLNGNNTGTDELRGGLLFTSDITAKTAFRFGAIYSRVHYVNSSQGEWNRWTGIVEARHHFTETFEARIGYQYQTRKSTLLGDSYDENLATLTVTKYFH